MRQLLQRFHRRLSGEIPRVSEVDVPGSTKGGQPEPNSADFEAGAAENRGHRLERVIPTRQTSRFRRPDLFAEVERTVDVSTPTSYTQPDPTIDPAYHRDERGGTISVHT